MSNYSFPNSDTKISSKRDSTGTENILVRLLPGERIEINKLAKESGDSQSGYIRRLLGLVPYPHKRRTHR